jgi:hypothetical protein
VGTQAAGAYQQGQADKSKRETQDLLQQIQLARQAQSDKMQRDLQQAQIGNYQSETAARLAPKPAEPFTLGKGQRRYGPDGKMVAEGAPEDPKAPLPGTPEWKAYKQWEYANAPQGVTYIKGEGDQGQPQYFAGTTKGTPSLKPMDVNAPQTGKGSALSGITMQTMGRMGTSYNDLKQTIDEMEKMENDPKFRSKLSAYSKSLMAGAETHPNADAHGAGGFASNMLGQYASGLAQKSLDPDLNTYLNLKQRVGTAFTELLPRPNQQLLQIEKGLSGIDVGWNPQLMTGIQARRRGGLDVLANILSQQGMLDESGNVTGTHNPGGTRAPARAPEGGGIARPSISKAQYDKLIANHYTPEEIAAKYTVAP